MKFTILRALLPTLFRRAMVVPATMPPGPATALPTLVPAILTPGSALPVTQWLLLLHANVLFLSLRVRMTKIDQEACASLRLEMFIEIALSIVLGAVVGVIIANYDVILRALRLKKQIQAYPSVFSSSPRFEDVDNLLQTFQPVQKEDPFKERLTKYEEAHNARVIFINHRTVKSPYSTLLDTDEVLTMEDAIAVLDILPMFHLLSLLF